MLKFNLTRPKDFHLASIIMLSLSSWMFTIYYLLCGNEIKTFFLMAYKGLIQQPFSSVFMSFSWNSHLSIHHCIFNIISSSESSSLPENILLTCFFIQNRICWYPAGRNRPRVYISTYDYLKLVPWLILLIRTFKYPSQQDGYCFIVPQFNVPLTG